MQDKLSKNKKITLLNLFFETVGFLVVFIILILSVYALLNYSFDTRSGAKSPRLQIIKDKPDLDVIYISRTPRFERYRVAYNSNGPIGYTGGDWPSEGDIITYVATVKNNGLGKTGPFSYKWYIDGKEISEYGGTHQGLSDGEDSGAYATFSLLHPWINQSQEIKFEVSPIEDIAEISVTNNSRQIISNGLIFKLYIEQSVYNEFASLPNIVGTFSFYDWAHAQMDKMNEIIRIGYEVYGFDQHENLGYESIYIDEIEIVPDGTLPNCCEHAPESIFWDGRWGFERDEWNSTKVNQWIESIENALIHEWTHQLGIIDEYRFNFDWNYVANNLVNGEVYYIPWQALMNDLNTLAYSRHTINGLYSNKGYRRGFYGEYLYDIPLNNQISAVNNEGFSICNAQIKFYQKDVSSEGDIIDNIVEIAGNTNSNGLYSLPNRDVISVNVATDHQLRPNPFGQISVVGNNSLFLVELTYQDQNYYDWLSIYRFNEEYWNGNIESATYELVFDVPTEILDSCGQEKN